MLDPKRTAKITKAVSKMPQWLRHDLNGGDPTARERAHEALVAMILSAIGDEDGKGQG